MLYRAYQAYSEASEPIRMMARAGLSLGPLFTGISEVGFGKHYVAALELISRTRLSHARPDYRVESTLVDGEPVPVHEKVVASLPFCNLVRFSKESAAPQPKMLVVAPLSGHFATLLRETVRTLVRDHEVYITDWKNARDVPLDEGPSASTITSTTSFAALSLSGRGRMCWQSVSPACRRSPLSR